MNFGNFCSASKQVPDAMCGQPQIDAGFVKHLPNYYLHQGGCILPRICLFGPMRAPGL